MRVTCAMESQPAVLLRSQRCTSAESGNSNTLTKIARNRSSISSIQFSTIVRQVALQGLCPAQGSTLALNADLKPGLACRLAAGHFGCPAQSFRRTKGTENSAPLPQWH